jgi:hypothetical protein
MAGHRMAGGHCGMTILADYAILAPDNMAGSVFIG